MSRKSLAGMLHSFLSKMYPYYWFKQGNIYGLVSLTFLCIQGMKGMVFGYLQKAAEGGNKRLQCISRYYSV